MKKLGELLVEEGLISAAALEKALKLQRESGGPLGSALVRLGFVTEERIRATLANKYGIANVDLQTTSPDPAAVRCVPREMAEAYSVLPVSLEGRRLTVAVSDPTDVSVLDELRFATGCEVVPVLASEADIRAAIQSEYRSAAGDDAGRSGRPVVTSGTGEDEVGMLLAILVANAIRRNATEIHLEPRSEGLEVRLRSRDGLHSVPLPSREMGDALAARILNLCHLDAAEKAGPQSGELSLEVTQDGRYQTVRLLVSTLGTLAGERICVELGRSENKIRDPGVLGLEPSALSRLGSRLEGTHGLVLITGPPRSGKTTTFYSFLSWLQRDERFLISAEDRIECTIDGVHQILMSDPVFQYAALTSLKPDVLCVRGLRTPEAVTTALDAARGRVVLAELEALNCASALHSFPEDSRYWLSRTVRFVVSQRLLPQLCADCREAAPISPETEDALRLRLSEEELENLRPFRSHGCSSCRGTGYRGLKGVFEWMDVDDVLRLELRGERTGASFRKVLPGVNSSTFRQTALRMISEGLIKLEDALSLVV